MGGSQKHREHECLREEVRSWYRASSPELGYQVVRRRFGFYRQHVEHPGSGLIIVDALLPDEVPEFLADASSYFDNRPLYVWLEDKDVDAELGPALVAAGVSMGKATTYLAHVGPRPEPFQSKREWLNLAVSLGGRSSISRLHPCQNTSRCRS
jgi:hypothetical protein